MPEIANPYNNPSLKRPRGGNLKGTPLQGAKVATVQHIVVLGCEKYRQYSTLSQQPTAPHSLLEVPGGVKTRNSRGARNCKSVQQPFFGKAPGRQLKGDPPSGGQSCDSTALCGPRLRKAPTVQHFVLLGPEKVRQYSTLWSSPSKSGDSTALCGPRLRKVPTVQHFVVPGHKKHRQHNTL